MDEELRTFFESYRDLSLVFLYGSQASGQATPSSDIDLGILGKKPYSVDELLDLTSQLRRKFKREIDLVDLRTSHGALLSEVLTRGKLIVLRDPEAYAQIIKRMWYEREDDGRFLEITLKERQKLWEK